MVDTHGAEGPLARRHRVRFIGKGERILVLSHGLGTDQSAWQGLIPELSRHFTLFLYDLPGASPLLPEDVDITRYRHISSYADDLLALLDECDVERCVFLGHSVSGMIGALAAVTEPERFQQLVMMNASPRYLNDGDYIGGFTPEALDGLFSAMKNHYETWVSGFAPMAIAADVPDAIRKFAEGFLAMRPDVTLMVAKSIFESDLRHILPLVTVPVLLVHSRHDVAVPEDVARCLQAHLPQNELVWIEADGHLPHLSAPDKVLAALEAHL